MPQQFYIKNSILSVYSPIMHAITNLTLTETPCWAETLIKLQWDNDAVKL